MQKYRRFLRFFLHVSEKCSNFVRFLVRSSAKGDYLVQKDQKQSKKNQKDKFNFWNILGHF